MSELSYLIYVSKQSYDLDQDDIDNILESSRVNNAQNNITGMLLYIEGNFFQVLEGKASYILELYEKITKDKRHQNSVIVSQGNLEKRIFKDWTMKFKALSKKEFEELSGITPFQKLFGLKPANIDNPALIFTKKFMNRKFPSVSWWGK